MPQPDKTYLVRCRSCGAANRVPAASEGKAGKCGNCHDQLPELHTQPVPLTDRTFGPFVGSYPAPILAEFWAPW